MKTTTTRSDRITGWSLLLARQLAGEVDWQRQFDAPDVAAAREAATGLRVERATSLNRRDCPHPRRRRDRHGLCLDCGAQVTL